MVFLKDLTWVGQLVEAVLPFKPESIESYDDKTMEFAVKLWRQVISFMKGNIITLGLQFLPRGLDGFEGGDAENDHVDRALPGNDEMELNSQLRALTRAIQNFSKTHSGYSGASNPSLKKGEEKILDHQAPKFCIIAQQHHRQGYRRRSLMISL